MPDETCGHELTDGGTCSFAASYPDGRCGHHTDESDTKQGRPTKLSYKRQERIAEALESGKSISIAARKNDVDPSTVVKWAEKGEADIENGKENEYTEFYQRFRRALGEKEDWYLETIIEIAKENGDHRFLMSMLANEFPDEWGDTNTGVEGTQVVIHDTADEYLKSRE